ncbi:MAG TPA: GspH/FimT family pseudopilin [Sphingomicrobium sp.]|nr:GspH/FimT family pseudopilin [Sphingomicrobium sp.]
MPRNGFTLVELMVVIALMALMAGAVVMTVGAPGGGPAAGATRFASRLAAARDEAIVSGRPMSAWVTPSGYGFDRFQGGRWQPMSAAPFEGDNWEPGTDVKLATATEARVRVRFDSLGLPDSPASVRLVRDGRTAEVRVAANGDVAVQ